MKAEKVLVSGLVDLNSGMAAGCRKCAEVSSMYISIQFVD